MLKHSFGDGCEPSHGQLTATETEGLKSWLAEPWGPALEIRGPEHYAVVPPSIMSKACDCGRAAVAEEHHYSSEGVWAAEYKCFDCRDDTLPIR